tara:strand:- start:466 stop:738 length:273 start_codon:yes stop_codon:yes gene_type:complete
MNHLSPFYQEKFQNEKLLILKEKELQQEAKQMIEKGSWLADLLGVKADFGIQNKGEKLEGQNIFQSGIQVYQNILKVISQIKDLIQELKK